ncbi:sialic acid-binding Ig-like lectin 12, partial [Cricetulus griseus]
MNVHCPCLLLTLGQVALLDPSPKWDVKHPPTLFAWEGACLLIPCKYTMPYKQDRLDKVFLYQKYDFDNDTKKFKGNVLYNNSKIGSPPSERGRVTFQGDNKNNCTLKIHPVHANDTGELGLRMVTSNDKWMEPIDLNISKTPFPPDIHVPSDIQASQNITLTCKLNFACFGYPIHLEWSLKEPETSSIPTITVEKVYTESQLTFQPQWSDHGKNVTCRVLHATKVLSENTVRLDVK